MKWDSKLYDEKHGFVSQYGNDLIALLAPQKGEQILDIGCGTGDLANEIARSGASVTGIDLSAEMIARAKEKFPSLSFHIASATDFMLPQRFDAIFSNATLHWILDKEAVIRQMYAHLKQGGRVVLEFGAKGNVGEIIGAVTQVLNKHGIPTKGRTDFFYYPSIGEYASLLEKHGFTVTWAAHFHRETPLADGENGIRHWLTMFGERFFTDLDSTTKNQFIDEVSAILKPTHFREGRFVADYQRLRIVAGK